MTRFPLRTSVHTTRLPQHGGVVVVVPRATLMTVAAAAGARPDAAVVVPRRAYIETSSEGRGGGALWDAPSGALRNSVPLT
jgi:hypothetical protein